MAERNEVDVEKIWKLVETARQHVARKKLPQSPNLMDLLTNTLAEWMEKTTDKCARMGGGLLEALTPDQLKVSLIVSLYGDEEGYSVMLPKSASEETQQQEVFMPYTDTDLLDYLDANEIPPVFFELFENSSQGHFYNGCLIAELRNYRGYFTSPDHCDRSYLLLQPPVECIQSAVARARSEYKLTYEQALHLEGSFLVATQPSLSLEPNTDIMYVANRLQYSRKKYKTHSVKRYLRKQLPGYRKYMSSLRSAPTPRYLRLGGFLDGVEDTEPSNPLEISVTTVTDTTTCDDVMKLDLTLPESLRGGFSHFKKYMDIEKDEEDKTPPSRLDKPVCFSPLKIPDGLPEDMDVDVFLRREPVTPEEEITTSMSTAPPSTSVLDDTPLVQHAPLSVAGPSRVPPVFSLPSVPPNMTPPTVISVAPPTISPLMTTSIMRPPLSTPVLPPSAAMPTTRLFMPPMKPVQKPATVPSSSTQPTLPTSMVPTPLPTSMVPTPLPTSMVPPTVPKSMVPTPLPTSMVPPTIPKSMVPTPLPTSMVLPTVPKSMVPTPLPTSMVPAMVPTSTASPTVPPSKVPLTIPPSMAPTVTTSTITPSHSSHVITPQSLFLSSPKLLSELISLHKANEITESQLKMLLEIMKVTRPPATPPLQSKSVTMSEPTVQPVIVTTTSGTGAQTAAKSALVSRVIATTVESPKASLSTTCPTTSPSVKPPPILKDSRPGLLTRVVSSRAPPKMTRPVLNPSTFRPTGRDSPKFIKLQCPASPSPPQLQSLVQTSHSGLHISKLISTPPRLRDPTLTPPPMSGSMQHVHTLDPGGHIGPPQLTKQTVFPSHSAVSQATPPQLKAAQVPIVTHTQMPQKVPVQPPQLKHGDQQPKQTMATTVPVDTTTMKQSTAIPPSLAARSTATPPPLASRPHATPPSLPPRMNPTPPHLQQRSSATPPSHLTQHSHSQTALPLKQGMSTPPQLKMHPKQANISQPPNISQQVNVVQPPNISQQTKATHPPNISQQTKAAHPPNINQQTNIAQRPNIGQQTNVPQHPSISQQANVPQRPTISQQTNVPQRPSISQQANVPQRPTISQQANVPQRPTISQQTNVPQRPSISQQANVPQRLSISQQANVPQRPSIGHTVLKQPTPIPPQLKPSLQLHPNKGPPLAAPPNLKEGTPPSLMKQKTRTSSSKQSK